MTAYVFPLLDVFWSMFVFFGMVIWIWVLITIFADLLRSQDIGGWTKAGWFLLVLVFPLLGALIYLIARGPLARAQEAPKYEDHPLHDVRREQPWGPSVAEELEKLADLAERGVITSEEFDRQKKKLLGEPAEGEETAA